MGFSFPFRITRKKLDTISNNSAPEVWGNSLFYPLRATGDNQNNSALIWMYKNLPEIQIPINYIADTMVIIDFQHERKQGDVWVKVENSPIVEVIRKPNQYQRKNDFIQDYFINRLVLGAGFINRVKAVGFRGAKRIYVLPSSGTEVVEDIVDRLDPRENDVKGYLVDFGNGKVALSKDEVVAEYESALQKGFTSYRSRLMSAFLTSESLKYNYEARVKIYKDRGALGIISPGDPTTQVGPEAKEQLKKQYYQNNGITGDKMPFLVATSKLDYTSIGFNVDDLKLKDFKLQDFQTICAIFGIDSNLFESSRGTFNNKVLAKKNYWEDVAIPQFNSYLQLLQEVFEMPENERLIADYTDVASLQEDYEKKVNANSKAWNDGITTEAEYREAIGYEGGREETKPQLTASTTAQSGEGGEDGQAN